MQDVGKYYKIKQQRIHIYECNAKQMERNNIN